MICWLQIPSSDPSLAIALLKLDARASGALASRKTLANALDPLTYPVDGICYSICCGVAKRRRRVLETQFTECIYTAPPGKQTYAAADSAWHFCTT
jgi:hypothetical protein